MSGPTKIENFYPKFDTKTTYSAYFDEEDLSDVLETYEQAVKKAQETADARKKDVVIYQAVAVVKYPTPSFEVQKL